MQPLEGRLRGYRERHLECTSGESMPGPYVVVRIEDKAAGIGNELPGIITGMRGPVGIRMWGQQLMPGCLSRAHVL